MSSKDEILLPKNANFFAGEDRMSVGSNFLCGHPPEPDPSPLCRRHKWMAPNCIGAVWQFYRTNIRVSFSSTPNACTSTIVIVKK